MAKQMSFAGRWGSACGRAFDAEKFLSAHPQFDWMRGILKSRPAQRWAVFRAGEKNWDDSGCADDRREILIVECLLRFGLDVAAAGQVGHATQALIRVGLR